MSRPEDLLPSTLTPWEDAAEMHLLLVVGVLVRARQEEKLPRLRGIPLPSERPKGLLLLP